MPQQLVYTSAPRGLVAGRSGYCTVARSTAMREALMLRLEQFSYYHHLSLTGGQNRAIFAYRVLDLRGSRYHVLSRIQDAGLDFTGRTNFIAHHLVLTPEEIRQFATPAVILRDWSGWVSSWNQEPQQFSKENWGNLGALAATFFLPARTWQRLTGGAVNGYALFEAKPGTFLSADGLAEEDVLALLAESTELMEVRDTRRDYRTFGWQSTFTTSIQEQDVAADFRLRLVHCDSPAFAKFVGTGCPSLASLRVSQVTQEEQAFAQKGWQAPTSVELRIDKTTITEGESVRLEAKADGIPIPSFRWFEKEHGELVGLAGRSGAVLEERPAGRAKHYVVQAVNRVGCKESRAVELTINQAARLASHEPVLVQPKRTRSGAGHIKTEEEIEAQRKRLESKKAEKLFRKRQWRRLVLSIGIAAAFLLGGIVLARHFIGKPTTRRTNLPPPDTNVVAKEVKAGASAPERPKATDDLGATVASSTNAGITATNGARVAATNSANTTTTTPQPSRASQTAVAQSQLPENEPRTFRLKDGLTYTGIIIDLKKEGIIIKIPGDSAQYTSRLAWELFDEDALAPEPKVIAFRKAQEAARRAAEQAQIAAEKAKVPKGKAMGQAQASPAQSTNNTRPLAIGSGQPHQAQPASETGRRNVMQDDNVSSNPTKTNGPQEVPRMQLTPREN